MTAAIDLIILSTTATLILAFTSTLMFVFIMAKLNVVIELLRGRRNDNETATVSKPLGNPRE